MATKATFTNRRKSIHNNNNNNNNGTNTIDSLFSKTLFIEGCDCGVITDETKYEDSNKTNNNTIEVGSDEYDDYSYLQLKYQTLQFYTPYNINNNNNNRNNNNNNIIINSQCEDEFEEEPGYEKLKYYNDDCLDENNNDGIESSTHGYATLEETIDEYSTNGSNWSDNHVYEFVI